MTQEKSRHKITVYSRIVSHREKSMLEKTASFLGSSPQTPKKQILSNSTWWKNPKNLQINGSAPGFPKNPVVASPRW